ncbi:DUF1638 domain-containing protein [Deltaproteobacteria bacterium]|nr:DUF1638 domain-containing protein [Deltaproteobacteria bacterium]
MKKQSTKIIACATVIEEMRPFFPRDIEYREMEPGLHLNADKLRGTLQDIIDEITADTQTIILGYGLCSMAAVGLKAANSTLIIPRVDDCISMFLGSQELYKSQLKKEPGTYFLSKGWIDAGVTLIEELKRTEERFGKRGAEIVKKRMLQEYKRLAYIDMGHDDQERYREFARRAAEELGLYYEEISGTTELIRKIINGPWDEKFIVASPGDVISFDDFKW